MDAVRRIFVRQMCDGGYQRHWIDSHFTKPHRPVQMRAGDAPGCTRLTHDFAPCDDRARLDIDAREMRQQREHAEAVIDDDGVASEIEIPSQHDAARVWSVNGRPGGGTEIGALMTAGGLAVGDRQPAEGAVRCAWHWSIKGTAPQTFGRQNRKRIGHRLRFFLDARELVLRWLTIFGSTLSCRVSYRYRSTTSDTCAVALAPLAVVP